MNIFQQKRQARRMMYSKGVMIGLFIFCAVLANGLFNMYGKARESLNRKNFSAHSLMQLEQREAKLKAQIDRLNSRTGLEEELRNRYSFSKEGERVIVIVEDENGTRCATTTDDASLTEKAATWIKRATLIE